MPDTTTDITVYGLLMFLADEGAITLNLDLQVGINALLEERLNIKGRDFVKMRPMDYDGTDDLD